MFLKPRKASTDPRVRSLLQKSARRGFAFGVDHSILRLDAIGDNTWLRSRAIVITFEECWPLAMKLQVNRELTSKQNALTAVANAAKQKDAAGLGALAHAYQEGDRSMLDSIPDQRALKIIAEAVQRPKAFFDWIIGESQSDASTAIIRAAQQYLPAATWPWDKACILAGALLATRGIPSIESANPFMGDFPYWVALDKHTAEGKVALRAVSEQLGITYRTIIWASFYCESAKVNRLLPSPWFDAEKGWRLRRAGLSPESAEELWSRAAPLVRDHLEAEALLLKDLLDSVPENSTPAQTSLL